MVHSVHTVVSFIVVFTSAEAYAVRFGTSNELQEPELFETELRCWQLERVGARGGGAVLDHSGGTITRSSEDNAIGTVGCAVYDSVGNAAVVTSTGGQTNKIAGRICNTSMI